MSFEGVESTMTPTSGSGDIESRLVKMLSPEPPAEESSPETETEETAEDQTLEAQDDTEQETEAGQETETDSEDQETEDDGISLEASQFAQLLGVDESALIVNEDGTVSLRTKVDGEIGQVKVQDLIRSYQTDAHVTRKSQALAEQRKAFEAETAQRAQEIQGRLSEVMSVTQMLEGQLTYEFNQVDWEGLKRDDPARWGVLRQEFQDRVTAINAAKQKAFTVAQQQTQEQQKKMQEAHQARLRQEAEALSTSIPEWNDPGVAEAQYGEMSKFLAEQYGFDPRDLNGVEDHRLILLARDAMKYRQGLKAGEKAVQKVKTLPKLQKPGVQRVNAEAAAKKAAQEKKLVRLRQNPNSTDALADMLKDRIKI